MEGKYNNDRKHRTVVCRKHFSKKAVIKKNVSDFWLQHTRYFRPWLHELTKQYKERGEFPLMACWLLPSYYSEPFDVEIAAVAALLIKDDDKVIERVAAFRHMFGASPYEWFKTRSFVSLSTAKNRYKRTAGVVNMRIAELMGSLYDNWGNRESAIPIILLKTFGENSYMNKLYTLRLVLGTSDGIGRGVWRITPSKLKSPLTDKTMTFLRTFFPDYKRVGIADSVLHLFGFNRECEMFYAVLAYEELQRRDPKACSRFATIYRGWYERGVHSTWQMWLGSKRILPNI